MERHGLRRPLHPFQQQLFGGLLELVGPQRPVQPVHAVPAAVRRQLQAFPRLRRGGGWRRPGGSRRPQPGGAGRQQPAVRRAHPSQAQGGRLRCS